MKKSKKSKPKYKFGAFLKQNAQPISQVSSLAGQLINTEDPGGAAVSGALQGAGAGAAFGPAGAIVGGLVGGATSFFGAEEARKKKKELQQQRENALTAELMSNAGNAYAKGGKLNTVASKLGVVQGGELEPISKDAVEVKANNPDQTDSVELEEAFVDHNEVIDRKNRVFSDELGFAKIAKKLEKQKSMSSRFSASNERIEQQLDNLFQEQESMKKGMSKGGKYKMFTGGKLTDPEPKISRITNQPYKNEIEYTRQQFVDNNIPANEEYVLGYFKRNPKATRVLSATAIDKNGAEFPNQVVDAFTDELQKSTMMNPKGDTAMYMSGEQFPTTDLVNTMTKMKKAKGGKLGTVDKLTYGEKLGGDPLRKYKPVQKLAKDGLDVTMKAISPMDLQPTKSTTVSKSSKKGFDFDVDKGITTAATFAPNLVSSVAQRKLKGPATPQLETTTRLQRMSANDQLANADRQGLLADQLIKNNTAQGSDIASATGNILAKKLASKNQIYGENQRVNAAIQGQEAALNTQIRARNTERMNDFNNASNEFSNLGQRLTTENIANLSSKILQQGREKNQMQFDKDALTINEAKFEDSGISSRFKAKLMKENPDAYKRIYGSKKMGGMIPKKLSRNKK